MDSSERVRRVLKHEETDRIPRNLWTLPRIEMFRKQELVDVLQKFTEDIGSPVCYYGHGTRCMGNPCNVGEYQDAWGCLWHVGEPGIIGKVKEYILAD